MAFMPALFLTYAVIMLDYNNYFKIMSTLFALIFLLILIVQTIFKRDYLPVIFNCHQKEDRSMKLSLKIFKLCNRCLGIYIGILISPLISFINIHYAYYLLLMIPLIIDGTLQYKTKYESNNVKRVLTGLLFGVGFIALLTIINYVFLQIALKLINLISNNILCVL